jgi:hypothetical protein
VEPASLGSVNTVAIANGKIVSGNITHIGNQDRLRREVVRHRRRR